MTPEQAEHILAATANQLLIGSVIADLSRRTEAACYRSQDILDAIGHRKLSAVFALAAWDNAREFPDKSFERMTEFGIGEDREVLRVISVCPYARLNREDPRNDVGRALCDPQIADAIGVLGEMEPALLQKALGRLVDAARAIMVLHPDEFRGMEGKGDRIMAQAVREYVAPTTSFRFSGVLMMAGNPDAFWLQQIQVDREGGIVSTLEAHPLRYTIDLTENPHFVPLEAA